MLWGFLIMSKVTIIIEAEEENEGGFGHTAILVKDDVVFIEELLDFYACAARAGGWTIIGIAEVKS
jgi:hypothetical protein